MATIKEAVLQRALSFPATTSGEKKQKKSARKSCKLKNMNSSEKGQEMSLQKPKDQGNGRRRASILLGVVSAVAFVAALGVCAALLNTKPAGPISSQNTHRDTENSHLQQRSLGSNQKFASDGAGGNLRTARSIPPTPGTPPRPTTSDGSCASTALLPPRSVPAAHIKGRGIHRGSWIASTSESSSVVPGYQQRWTCSDLFNERHPGQQQAFVDGGVLFNQTDKSIYVPTCGYYHLYSQVLFRMSENPLNSSVTIRHILKIQTNCSSPRDSTPIQLQAQASIASHQGDNRDGGIATTYTSDTVYLCEGGRMWVEIPDGPNGVPCCPQGDDTGTFMGLVLISRVPCSHWPPTITMTYHY